MTDRNARALRALKRLFDATYSVLCNRAVSETLTPGRTRRAPATIEPLEIRRLLSTITWVNQGNDNFGIYGADTNVARQIVNRAIGDWERVIVNFRYDDTGPSLNNNFNLTVNAGDVGGGDRGQHLNTGRDDATDRKPTSATITLDDNGGGFGWYFDPNVGDADFPEDGEYTRPINLFAANIALGGPTGADFYRTAVHEIGHAMGLNSASTLKIASFLVNSGFTDPKNPSATLFTLNTFGGPAPEYTVTTTGGLHLWEGDGPGGIDLPEHPNDLMNPGRTVTGSTNRRQLISDTDALLLADVYNYQIVAPSQINTFFANVNHDTKVLTLTGDLNFTTHFNTPINLPNDFIDMEHGGIVSTFELSNGAVAREKIPETFFNTIIVNAGAGNDTVEINGVEMGKTVIVNLGNGDDGVVFGGEPGFVSGIRSNVTVNGDSGSNGVVFRDHNAPTGGGWTFATGTVVKSGRIFTLNSIQDRSVFGSGLNDVFTVNATPAGTTLNLNGNAGSDLFRLGDGILATQLGGPITVNGGAGNDFIELRDHADALGDDVWTFNAGTVAKPNMPLITYNTVESIDVSAGVHDDVFNVNAATAALRLDGRSGNDTFNIGNGNLNNLSRVTVQGGGGDDRLVINDSLDTGNDAYTIAAGIITKPGAPGAFQAIELNTQIGLEVERTILLANGGNNHIAVTGGRGIEIQSGAGNDVVQVLDHVPGLPVVIDTGIGLDSVLLNDDSLGNVTAEFRSGQTLLELHLFSGSRLNVAQGSNATIQIAQFLTLTTTGAGSLLDINDNTMIFRAAVGAQLTTLRSRLASGYNAGPWNGTQGITSTTARLSATADGIAYGTGGQLGVTTFNGIPIASGDVVLDHTLQGDANVDHIVNLTDFNRVAANFGQTGLFWIHGDFNYDGSVNLADFNRLAGNFGASIGVAGRSALAADDDGEHSSIWSAELI